MHRLTVLNRSVHVRNSCSILSIDLPLNPLCYIIDAIPDGLMDKRKAYFLQILCISGKCILAQTTATHITSTAKQCFQWENKSKTPCKDRLGQQSLGQKNEANAEVP